MLLDFFLNPLAAISFQYFRSKSLDFVLRKDESEPGDSGQHPSDQLKTDISLVVHL